MLPIAPSQKMVRKGKTEGVRVGTTETTTVCCCCGGRETGSKQEQSGHYQIMWHQNADLPP